MSKESDLKKVSQYKKDVIKKIIGLGKQCNLSNLKEIGEIKKINNTSEIVDLESKIAEIIFQQFKVEKIDSASKASTLLNDMKYLKTIKKELPDYEKLRTTIATELISKIENEMNEHDVTFNTLIKFYHDKVDTVDTVKDLKDYLDDLKSGSKEYFDNIDALTSHDDIKHSKELITVGNIVLKNYNEYSALEKLFHDKIEKCKMLQQQVVLQQDQAQLPKAPQQVLEKASAILEKVSAQQDPQNQNRTNQQGQSPPKGYSKE